MTGPAGGSSKRPLSVTIIGGLFLAVGIIGIGVHLTEFNLRHLFESGVIWAVLIRLLAIVIGAYVLRGSNRARWLALVWMGYHVILGWLHSVFQLVVHAVLFGLLVFFLFRARAAEYFRGPDR